MNAHTLVYSGVALACAAMLGSCASGAKEEAEKKAAEQRALLVESAHADRRLMEARIGAQESGADTQHSELFSQIQDVERQSTDAKIEGDLKKAAGVASEAADKYEILRNRVEVADLQSKIQTHQLAQYDGDSANAAEESWKKALELYETDSAQCLQSTVEALESYRKVAHEGFGRLLPDMKARAGAAKTDVGGLKVAVELRPQLEEADSQYQEAREAEEVNARAKAFSGYHRAIEIYTELGKVVRLKKTEAEKALQSAKTKQKASSDLARSADKSAPLPENAQGFSKEPIEVEPLPNDRLNTTQADESAPIPISDTSSPSRVQSRGVEDGGRSPKSSMNEEGASR